MIRLSQLTAFDVSKTNVARDLDVSPKLYAYQWTENNRTNSLLLQEDTSLLSQNTRKHALGTFFNNVLLGTSNFFPEQGLDVANYHADSELHELMNKVTLPSIEYKQAKLYFSQGVVGNPSIVGHWIKVYCKRSNGTEVVLASIVDFANDSNILATQSKLFESQIYNESLSFEFVDVEYLLSSNVSEIQAIRTLLFGNDRPTEYFIEYSAFGSESVDPFVENGYAFTRVNVKVINQQSMPLTFENSEMLAELKISNNGYSVSSQMIHQRYDIESYLDTLKQPDETYSVEHTFTISEYDASNVAIATYSNVISNPTEQFNTIEWRPIIDPLTDHFQVDVDIRIMNNQTGLIFRRQNSIIVTDTNVHNFKAEPTFALTGLTSSIVQQTVNRQVTKIVQSSETPKIITIEKKLYVSVQPADSLTLFDADFYAELSPSIDVTSQSNLYLQIDKNVIENELNKLTTFKIPKSAYSTTVNKYLLLDSEQNVITSGTIVR